MAIVVTSKLRFVRDALCALVAASGYPGPVDAMELAPSSWSQLRTSPRVLFVLSEAGEGIRQVAEFRASHPGTRIGVLAFGDRDEDFIAWARVGISGYLEPDASAATIVSMLMRVAAGEVVYPSRLSALLLNQFASRPHAQDRQVGIDVLTRREIDVIELLADGRANKQIARRLGITDATVKNHVHNILEKLSLRSRGEAAAFYRRAIASHAPLGFDVSHLGPLGIPVPFPPDHGADKSFDAVTTAPAE